MHKERLEHLKQTLLDVKARDEAQGHSHFNMDNWANSIEVDCMTVCCALGWECTTPEAQAQGLRLSTENLCRHTPVYTEQGEYYGYMAGAKYFDISYNSSEILFAPSWYTGDNWGNNSETITIDQVIDRIDYLLERGENALSALAEAEALEYKTAHLKLLEDKEARNV